MCGLLVHIDCVGLTLDSYQISSCDLLKEQPLHIGCLPFSSVSNPKEQLHLLLAWPTVPAHSFHFYTTLTDCFGIFLPALRSKLWSLTQQNVLRTWLNETYSLLFLWLVLRLECPSPLPKITYAERQCPELPRVVFTFLDIGCRPSSVSYQGAHGLQDMQGSAYLKFSFSQAALLTNTALWPLFTSRSLLTPFPR